MFGKAKKADAPKPGKGGAVPDVKIGSAQFGEEELEIREIHLKGLRIPNPGGGNIIQGQRFHFVLVLGEGEKATSFKAVCHAVTASEDEVIGKFVDMEDDEKRLIALHLKALRALGIIK